MSRNRRVFLEQLSLGIVGATVAGMPADALAFGRKRRTTCESIPEIIHPIKPFDVTSDIKMSFPTMSPSSDSSNPTLINGNGSFYVWGGFDSTIVAGVLDLQVISADGSTVLM